MTSHKSDRLTTEQIALTSKYLAEMTERFASPIAAIQPLFGRCCLATLPSSIPCWDTLTREASWVAAGILSHPDPASLSLDPLPIIEIYTMIKQIDREVPEMRQILERVGPDLEALSPEVRSTGRVRQITSALSKLGFPNELARPSKEAKNLLNEKESWFSAPALQLADLADHLLADDVPLDETDTKILSLIALGELRNYHLDIGCKLLRTVLQLGVPGEETRDGVDFIALQRRRDGRYGFLDRLAEKPEQTADPDTTLFLPMTLNAAWLFKTEAASMAMSSALAAVGEEV